MDVIDPDALILRAHIGGGFLGESDGTGERFILGKHGDGRMDGQLRR
jgi:hypothetical protein